MASNTVTVRIVGKDELSPASKSAGLSLDTLGGKAGSLQSKLGGLDTKGFGKKLDEMQGHTGAVGQALGGLGVNFSDVLGSGGIAGGALAGGAAAAAGFAIKVIGNFQDTAQSVLHFQQIAGTTADQSSRWVATFDQYGVAADSAGTLVGKFAKLVGNSPDKVQALGVQIAKTKDGSVDLNQTLINAIGTLNGIKDPAQRAAAAAQLFGKSWQDMSKLIDAGATAVQTDFQNISGGRIFTQDQLQTSEQLRVALDNLNQAAQGLELTLAKTLAPAIADVAGALSTVAGYADDALAPLGGLGGIVDHLVQNFINPIGAAQDLGNAMITAGKVGGGALQTIGDDMLHPTQALDALKGGWDSVFGGGGSDKVKQTQAAVIDYSGSVRALLGNTDDLTVKTLTASQAQADATEKAKEAKAAADGLATEQQNLRDRYKEATDAILAQYDALTKNTTGFIDAELAQLSDKKAIEDYKTQLKDAKATQDDHTASLLGTEKQLIDTATQTAAAEVANQHFATAADQASAASQAQIGYLQGVANQLAPNDPLRVGLQGYIDKLKNIPAEAATTVIADTATASAQIAGIINQLNSIPFEKDVHVKATVGLVKQAHGGEISAAALGGPKSGLVLVGEAGPELVRLPAGSYVNNASATAGMAGSLKAGGFGGGGATTINLTVNAGMGTDGHMVGKQIVDALKQYERGNGTVPIRVTSARTVQG